MLINRPRSKQTMLFCKFKKYITRCGTCRSESPKVIGKQAYYFRARQRGAASKVKSESHFGKQLGNSLGIRIRRGGTLADSPSRVPLLKDEGQEPTK
jgi:hypothetical protein